MSWYNTQGTGPSYILFSKVRYTRNIAKQSFPHILDGKRTEDATARLDTLLTSNGFRGEGTVSGATPAMLSLAERHLVERDFVYSERRRALYLNDPCNLVIAIGGDDFISISSVVSGLSVLEAKNMASEAEDMIDREIAFAYSDNIGYLSPNIADCGSGLTFSALLYLPSLRLICAVEEMQKALISHGMTLFPTFTGAKGDLYTLSYTPHHLADEDRAAVHFSDTVSSIIEKEKKELGMIFSGKGKIIYAEARRALGTLLYCESISEDELLTCLSSIRLCLCLSSETQAQSLPSLTELNFLCAEGLSASIVATAKEPCASIEDCNTERASLVRRYIQHKSEVK